MLEQLTAFGFRVRFRDMTPCADFGVWCPFGRRGLRANKFWCWIPAGDGTFRRGVVPGPVYLAQWQASLKVCTVACLLLRCVSRSAPDMYGETVNKLADTWPDFRHLVATADGKLRAEQLYRIQRTIQAGIDAGAVPDTEWRTSPWSVSYRQGGPRRSPLGLAGAAPAAAWTARGGRGQLRAPEVEVARTLVPGGVPALAPAVDHAASPSDKHRRGKKRKAQRKLDRADATRARARSSSGSFPPGPRS